MPGKNLTKDDFPVAEGEKNKQTLNSENETSKKKRLSQSLAHRNVRILKKRYKRLSKLEIERHNSCQRLLTTGIDALKV
jgi:hypothetical protein